MKKLLSILIFTTISSTVFARGLTTVPRVTLSGMNYLNGKSVTAFFVSGRAPGFSTPGSMPRVRSVFKKVGSMKISNGTVSIPSTSFIESGWSKYNYLQVIVHNPSQKLWESETLMVQFLMVKLGLSQMTLLRLTTSEFTL